MQIQWLDTSDAKSAGSSILLLVGENGAFGLGEVHVAVGLVKAAVLHLMKASAGLLVNIDLTNINIALDAVSRVTDEDANAGPPVRAAFDTALHDLNGKLRGCPLHVVLGGKYRSEIALSRHFQAGAPVPDSDEGIEAVLLDFRSEPARQAGSYGPNSATGWLASTIDRLGAAVQVDIDCKGTFDNPAHARTFVEGLLSGAPRLNVGLLQPLSDTDLVGHGALCAALPIPIILDSSVRSAKIMGQIVRLAAADRIVVNIERVGGFREAMQVVSIAEAASIGVSSSSFTCTAVGAAAALHLATVLHDCFPARLDNLLTDAGPIADVGFALDGGVAKVGTAPGLGVILRDDAKAAFQSAL